MSDIKIASVISFIMGLFAMGVVTYNVGPNSGAKVAELREKCELNIPRSQQCVMQFVPEQKKHE